MKQMEDQITYELKLPAKRGRPSLGNPKTAAQRKTDQRKREDAEIWQNPDNPDFSNISDAGLIAQFSGRKATHSVAEKAWLELGRRRGFVTG
ncbi:MAG: hypothetical protein PHD43_22390 [Methylococcales bacterium]|nr:hypothetical protein [Methylococcales bacterium]